MYCVQFVINENLEEINRNESIGAFLPLSVVEDIGSELKKKNKKYHIVNF